MMKKFIFIGLLLSAPQAFANPLQSIKVVSRYSVKMMCTCLYTMKKSEQFCFDYSSQLDSFVVKIETNKTVKAKLFGVFTIAEAQYKNDNCIVD